MKVFLTQYRKSLLLDAIAEEAEYGGVDYWNSVAQAVSECEPGPLEITPEEEAIIDAGGEGDLSQAGIVILAGQYLFGYWPEEEKS